MNKLTIAVLAASLALGAPASAGVAPYSWGASAWGFVAKIGRAIASNNGGASNTSSTAYDAKQRQHLNVLADPKATRAQKDAARRASMRLSAEQSERDADPAGLGRSLAEQRRADKN